MAKFYALIHLKQLISFEKTFRCDDSCLLNCDDDGDDSDVDVAVDIKTKCKHFKLLSLPN